MYTTVRSFCLVERKTLFSQHNIPPLPVRLTLLECSVYHYNDEGSNEANSGSGQIMAYIHDPEGKPFCYGIPRSECYGVRLAADYNGEVPPQMLILDVPEAEYAVFAVPDAGSPEELNVNIRNTMKFIFAQWLISSDYALAHEKTLFEYYMGKETFVYVPVNKK